MPRELKNDVTEVKARHCVRAVAGVSNDADWRAEDCSPCPPVDDLDKERRRSPEQIRIVLLATESLTLREVSEMMHRVRELPFRPFNLPPAIWKRLAATHGLCRRFGRWLPANLFNLLWRLNLVVNPVFECDTQATLEEFTILKPRSLAWSIHQL